MLTSVKNIPDALIYEIDRGEPIYYREYQTVLDNKSTIENVMGSSLLQSAIITQLVLQLGSKLSHRFLLLTNELGIVFSDTSRRAADIALVSHERLKGRSLNNRYIDFPPDIVIEVDTKAELKETADTFSYYHTKTRQLLDFGVRQVVWIFTDLATIMVAEPDQDWQLIDWQKDIHVAGEVINVATLVEQVKSTYGLDM